MIAAYSRPTGPLGLIISAARRPRADPPDEADRQGRSPEEQREDLLPYRLQAFEHRRLDQQADEVAGLQEMGVQRLKQGLTGDQQQAADHRQRHHSDRL